MAATTPDMTSQTDQRSPADSAEIVRILDSDTETLTGAVAAGTLSLEDLDQFVREADRGVVGGRGSAGAVIRIVRSLLGDTAPAWEEMEPAGLPVGA
ncbi:hypothetical protein [Halorubrum sp. DTA46]|uniref:hypothetical protein n=1 Tax=Halorubrum sp. DTA46 TaxID=3402162 RepID=UPI003AAD20F4